MGKKEIVFASHNANKAKEIQQMLGDGFEVKTLTDIGCTEDIAETGSTMAENASIKSRYVYEKYGLDCFADDSGLEVDALNGAPGVYSARYAGSQRNDEDNMHLLLLNLQNESNRGAQFKTVISLIIQGTEMQFEGTLRGNITHEKKGNEGFGYDPIFRPEHATKTLAEISLSEKNKISHRARAVQQLIAYLTR